jgi:tetratricopeptide (TPR) repeat protein/tRNA A-37 threonylcarbamoyl transferase component Bud32
MNSARKPSVPSSSAEDLAGSRVDRFVIRSRLGSGGMGEVYYAEDTKLHRPVALKRVTRKLRSDPDARRHILKEAQRASALSSEHIASVYDVVEGHGELFLVMEYVEGITLRQRLLSTGRMSLSSFLNVAVQCAEALAEAQRRGIVHRDVKPENIMLSGADHVKILDFGLARRLPVADHTAITASMESQSLHCVGTPGYMAPEVLLEKEVDGRADIFSLGVVFYEMLTGQSPFETKKLIGTADSILHAQPRPMGKLVGGVPAELERIVGRMLAKDPSLRYQSAGDLLVDLRTLQSAVAPGHRLNLLTRFGGHAFWPRVLVGAAAVFLCLAVAWGFYARTHSPAKLAARSWVLIADFDNFGDQSVPDKGAREAFTIALQQSRYLNVLPRARVYEALQRMKRPDVTHIDEAIGREVCRREDAKALLAGSIARIDNTFQISVWATDPVHGNLLLAENTRITDRGQFFEEVDSLARKVRNRLGESLSGIEESSRPLARVTTNSLEALQLYSQALDLMAQGNPEQARGLLEGALARDPNFAMAYLHLGDCYSSVIGKTERAMAEMQRAYELRQTVTERERLWIEGQYHNFQESYELAAQSFTALVNLYPDDAEAHEQLAQANENLGRLDVAISEQRRALELDPNSVPGFTALILWLARTNQNDDAIRTYELASHRGMESPYLRWGLGMAYLGQDQTAGAREQFQSMSHGSPVEAELGQIYLAVADLWEGKMGAAEAKLSSGLPQQSAARESLSSVRHYLLGRTSLLLGDARSGKRQAELILAMPSSDLQTIDLLLAGKLLVDAGDTERASQVLHRLMTIRQRTPTGWNNASFHCLEGEILLAEGRVDQALASFQSAVGEFEDPTFHLGLARADQRKQDWVHASEQFEQFLKEQGQVLQQGFPPDLALAHFELGRVYRHTNDLSRAEGHYQQLLAMWRQGDDIPIRRLAVRELQQVHSSRD